MKIHRLASFGMAVTILLLTVYLIGANALNLQDTAQASESVHMSDLYQQTRQLVRTEESLANEYALQPTLPVRTEYHSTNTQLLQSLRALQREGDGGDRAFVTRILPLQDSYFLLTSQMFTAIDNQQMAVAKNIHDQEMEPLSTRLDALVNSAANQDHQMATQKLAALHRMQQFILLITSIVLIVGILLLVLCWWLLHSYRRKLDETTCSHIAQLERAAFTDSLTSLNNHRAFQEEFRSALEQARQQNDILGLALVNVDEFKLINDAHGHLFGDAVLSRVAVLLRDVTTQATAYRLEGDQFALLLSGLSVVEITQLMLHLCQEAPRQLSGITLSTGIAVSEPGSNANETLQEQADAALRESKRRGRNRIVSFAEIQESTTHITSTKARAVQRLLAEGRVNVAFQPIWDIKRNSLLAFEALTRPAADYGFSGPQEAFDLADKLGHGPELDMICLRAILARAGELPSRALLFVNLAPQTLDSDLIAGSVLVREVEAAGLIPDRIVLEITERSMARPDVIVREARRLRGLGFGLALDDAGAGNAGLEMLSQLSVDFIKIDRDVVVRALSEQAARGVLAGITAIARETATSVIAEGIENVEMFDMVRKAGVQAVQGYLLGRPSETIPDETILQRLSPLAQIA